MPSFDIQREKVSQIAAILQENQIDAWLTFVQETNMSPDPVLPLILGMNMTWLSAFIHTATGEHIAIIGRFDAENVRMMGGYERVLPYDQDIFPLLLAELERLDPAIIALNYSTDDVASCGLSHGLWLLLTKALAGTPYVGRLLTAGPVIGALRGRKSAHEVAAVRKAVATTEQIISQITTVLAPGLDEVSLFNKVRGWMAERGVKPAWDACPNITAGATSVAGHGLPDARHHVTRGQLVHIDIGVEQDDYVSDLQRVWYMAQPGESQAPQPVQHAFDSVREAILAAAEVLRPGVPGWHVDKAARDTITARGYPEFQHAVGHQVGRTVHDGAGVLAPRWPRYGKSPEVLVEAGNIFTLELGVQVPSYGFIGLEEDVLVQPDGLTWLSNPQTSLMIVGG